jgi:hypothetical protein
MLDKLRIRLEMETQAKEAAEQVINGKKPF